MIAPPRPRLRGRRVYSAETRKVWRANRIDRKHKVMLTVGIVLLLVSIAGIWLTLGAPTRLEDIPLFDQLVD